MKILQDSTPDEMLAYWRSYEGIPVHTPVRTDILNSTYPSGVTWKIAEILDVDIPSMFMISVHDFGPISRNTWRVSIAAEHYLNGFTDNDHLLRINKLLARPHFDPRVIIVSNAIDGPYTIVDGNHRAVILQSRQQLVGQTCFLGIHPSIRSFNHAGMSFQNRN